MPFGKRKERYNVVAETLRRLAAECGGPMGAVAFDVFVDTVREGNGLGFLPRSRVSRGQAERLQGREAPRIEQVFYEQVFHEFTGSTPERERPRRAAARPDAESSRKPRGGGGMPFAKDFGTGRSKGRAGSSKTSNPFGAAWERDPPPRSARAAPHQNNVDLEIINAYATLGLAFGSDESKIKARKRDLAIRLHSDLHGPGGEERMKRVNAAASVLKAWIRAGRPTL